MVACWLRQAAYQIDYMTEHLVDTCHARLTLRWTLPNGWVPGFADASCRSHTL